MEINQAFAKISLSLTVFGLFTVSYIWAQNLEFPKNIPRTPVKPQFNPPPKTSQQPKPRVPASNPRPTRIPAPQPPIYIPNPIFYPPGRSDQPTGSSKNPDRWDTAMGPRNQGTINGAPLNRPDENGVTHIAFLGGPNPMKMYACPNPPIKKEAWLFKSGILDTLKVLSPKIEVFEIGHAERAFEIKTQSGIALKFPENAFSDALGNPILGKIQVSVQHFQSKVDFASAGLTSSATDGQALESGGMIDVNAKSGNADIRIADGKSYKIEGNSPYKEGFETFYGVDGNQTTWTTNTSAASLTGASSNSQGNQNGEGSQNKNYTLSLLPITRSINGVAHSLIVEDLGEEMPLSQWFYQNAKISKELKKRIKVDGIVFPAKLTLNSTGQIIDVQLVDSAQAKNSLISESFEDFRKLLISAPKAHFNDTLGLPSSLLIRFSTLDVNFSKTKQLPLPPVVSGVQKMATNNGGKWALESYNTRLVNCDRFSKFSKSDDSITYKIDQGRALVYLNFHDINALLGPSTTRQENSGYAYAMHQFPVGSNARLIAIVYDAQGGVHLEVSDVSPGKYHIEKTTKYPFNQLTVRAAFEMQPMDLFGAKN